MIALGFHPGNSRIHQLNATVDLFLFILYFCNGMSDRNLLNLIITLLSSIVQSAHMEWKRVWLCIKIDSVFNDVKILLHVYIFDPEYGVKILIDKYRLSQWY